MIRILLVDDQALLCEVLKTWLEVEADFQVVGIAHNGEEAIALVETFQPNIVLMDIDMPQMDGIHATKIIGSRFPEVKVILLSGHDSDAYLGKSLRSGAKGYLIKNTTAEELAQKIREVHHNFNLLEISGNIDDPANLKAELEQLIGNYRQQLETQLQQYQISVEKIEKIEQLDRKYQQRLGILETWLRDNQGFKSNELEQKYKSHWEAIRQEINNLQTQFDETNTNLSYQFNQQLVNLKRELNAQVTSALDDWSRQRAALQEWAVQRDEMRPSMEEYEAKHRNELMSVVNPLRASFRDTEKQIGTMRNGLIASIILSLLALTTSSYFLVTNMVTNNAPSVTPDRRI
jgi:DNA-binding NarL/FixJ family response regulator